MITEQDLQEAIAECQGERNPNAQTCIKLAAFYTILDNIRKPEPQDFGASYTAAPTVIMPPLYSGTMQKIRAKTQ